MSLLDDHREQVLELHSLGLTRSAITAQMPISTQSVSRIVAQAGRTFAGAQQTRAATQGRIRKCTQAGIAKLDSLMSEYHQADPNGAAARGLLKTIDRLAGFGPAEMLLGIEKDDQWIAKRLGWNANHRG